MPRGLICENDFYPSGQNCWTILWAKYKRLRKTDLSTYFLDRRERDWELEIRSSNYLERSERLRRKDWCANYHEKQEVNRQGQNEISRLCSLMITMYAMYIFVPCWLSKRILSIHFLKRSERLWWTKFLAPSALFPASFLAFRIITFACLFMNKFHKTMVFFRLRCGSNLEFAHSWRGRYRLEPGCPKSSEIPLGFFLRHIFLRSYWRPSLDEYKDYEQRSEDPIVVFKGSFDLIGWALEPRESHQKWPRFLRKYHALLQKLKKSSFPEILALKILNNSKYYISEVTIQISHRYSQIRQINQHYP